MNQPQSGLFPATPLQPIMIIQDDDLLTATPQQVFDYATARMLRQGEKSVESDGACIYNGPGGLRCAVGCLISDERYHQNPDYMESVAYNNFLESVGIDLLGCGSEDGTERVLEELQEVHDSNSPEAWADEFAACAFHAENTNIGMEITFDEQRARHAEFVPYVR